MIDARFNAWLEECYRDGKTRSEMLQELEILAQAQGNPIENCRSMAELWISRLGQLKEEKSK